MRDEIDLKKESDIYWFMMTYSDTVMTKEDDRTVILTQNGKKLKLTFITDAETAELSYGAAEPLAESYHNPEDVAVDANRLAIKLHGSGSVSITVKLTPMEIEASSVSAYNKPMNTWELPHLTAEKVNGSCNISGTAYWPEGSTAFLAIVTKKNGVIQAISVQPYSNGFINVDTAVPCNDDECVSAYLMTDKLAPLCKSADTNP